MKKFKKKIIILLVIGILIVTTMSIGVTYSYMKPKAEKENNQTEIGINNCAKITLKDNNSTINLTNMYPMEEEMGLQTEAYEFTISSTCEEYTGFNLYLTTLNDNEIKDKDIRYAVTDMDDNILITDLLTNKNEELDLTEEEIKELEQGIENKRGNTYKVFNNNLSIKEEKTYKLRLWLDENANNDTMKQSFKIKVSIKGYDWDGTIANYLITNRNNSLLYHNGTIKDMDGNIIDAEDLSYRYSGGNDIVHNYVCFGSSEEKCPEENLYRIIGLFQNNQNQYEMKIIKATLATSTSLGVNAAFDGDSYYWNYSKTEEYEGKETNDWGKSNLNIDNLNGYYLNEYLKPKDDGKWYSMIKKHTWITAGNTVDKIVPWNEFLYIKQVYENEIENPNVGIVLSNVAKEVTAKVGLMYINDYGYATYKKAWYEKSLNYYDNEEVKENNWMYRGTYEWTITRNATYDNHVYSIDINGNIIGSNGNGVKDWAFHARPTMYLDTNVKIISGTGTANNPYVIDI